MMQAILIILLAVANASTYANVLHVPAQYPLIQMAIDNSSSGDTVLVESGMYQEALFLSDMSLTIMGADLPDTLTGQGTILDPTGQVNSNFLACLTLQYCDSVRLERLWFRNGYAMYVDRATNAAGGINNERGARYLELKSCRFDSVHIGVKDGTVIRLDSVVMHDAQQWCVSYGDSGRVLATDCRFEGSMAGIAVTAWSGSQFTRCSFRDSDGGYLLTAGRDSILIRECQFGPINSGCNEAVNIRPGNGTIIEGNVFQNLNTGGVALRVLVGNCSTIVDPDFRFPVIRNNIFREIGPGTACQSGFALEIGCLGWAEGFLGYVENNIFDSSLSQGHFANAIDVEQGVARLDSNQFRYLRPGTCPAIYSRNVQPPETLLIRSNEFDSLAYAVGHSSNMEFTDARWNWWGDNSGPFNSSMNPTGLGAAVDDSVLFDPWIMREDTTNISIDDEHFEYHPSLFTLAAFPNPFNAVTTLVIEVARAGEYDVKLYDLTGREAAALFSGRVESRAEVSVIASGLASGVYFAALQNQQSNVAVTKVLLLK